MFFLSRVVFVVLLQSTTGNYCSLSDTNINCVPCERCNSRGQICYICPQQCGKQNSCKNVCAPNCRNGTCEYLASGSVPVCARGCNPGFTGKQCQEYCFGRCKECDQEFGNCTSCMEGFKGDNCNLAILSSTSAANSLSASMGECAKECDFCNDTVTLCEKCTDPRKCQHPCGCYGLRLTTDPTQFPLTSTSTEDSMNTHPQTTPPSTESTVTSSDKTTAYTEGSLVWYKMSTAVAAAVAAVLVICVAMICYRKRSTYREMESRPCGRDRTTNYNTDWSSLTYTGYTYIDETNLGSCHDRTNVRQLNVPRCSDDNYYEEMGNGLSLAEEDNGSESTVSAWSGTLFGNLFEVNNESDTHSHLTLSEGQLNEDAIIDLAEVYKMNCLNYITPEVTLHANQGVSDV